MKLLNVVLLSVVSLGACATTSAAATSRTPKKVQSAPDSRKPLTAITPAQKAAVTRALIKQPLSFEKNQGQTDPRVKYISRGSNYTVFLTPDEAVLTVPRPATQAKLEAAGLGSGHAGRIRTAPASQEMAVLRMRLEGANPAAAISAGDPLDTRIYHVSESSSGPLSPSPHYRRVEYSQVYPGIDLVYYGTQRQVQFDFVVAPGADPKQIVLSFRGAESIVTAEDGHLSLGVHGREISLRKPFIYQTVNGAKKEVAGRFRVEKGLQVRFALDDYDASLPLVIDPLIDYATYLGTSGDENVVGIGLNTTSGEVYVLGNSTTYVGPGFLSKFDTTLTDLRSSIVFDFFEVHAMAVAPNGDIDVIGGGGYFKRLLILHESPVGNVQVTTRRDLVNLANNHISDINGFGVDAANNVYVLGFSYVLDPGFAVPPLNGFDTGQFGGNSGLLAKYDSQGNLVYGTVIRAPEGDVDAAGLAIDDSGIAYVVGFYSIANSTTVTGLRTTSDARHPTLEGCQHNGSFNCTAAFLMKIDTTKTGDPSLIYSSYLDPMAAPIANQRLGDSATSVAVDSAGAVYVAGSNSGARFGLANTRDLTAKDFAKGGGYTNDGYGYFVTKMNLSLPPDQQVVFTSTFGGNETTQGWVDGISLLPSGNILVYGRLQQNNGTNLGPPIDFPYVDQIFAPPAPGSTESRAFLAELSASGDRLVFSTPLGTGPTTVRPHAAVTAPGDLYVVVETQEDGRATAGAFQPSRAGLTDLLLFSLIRSPMANPQSVTVDSDQQVGVILTGSDPQGDPITFAIASPPAHGALVDNLPPGSPSRTYTPTPGFAGSDSFTFTVSDGQSISASATVSIVVRGYTDVSVDVYVNPATVDVGQEVSILAAVSNNGRYPATNVMLTMSGVTSDFTGVSLGSTHGTCEAIVAGNPVQCTLGTIAAGAQALISIFATPTSAVVPTGLSSTSVGILADVVATETDPNTLNNHFSGSYGVNLPPGQFTDTSGVPLSFITLQGVVTVTFSSVTQLGFTNVTTTLIAPPLPVGFNLNGAFYDITTTALYTPPITVCFTGSFAAGDRIMHYEAGAWVTLPGPPLPLSGPPFTTICAQTASLSPFAVVSPVNHAPIANAGPNQTVEATSPTGAVVTLNGSGSDPDGDPLSYSWSGPCGSASSAVATLNCPIGVNSMTLTVSDGRGGVASGVVLITVQETKPPTTEARICTTLGGKKLPDVDLFYFRGIKGETVTLRLDPNPSGTYTDGGAALLLVGYGLLKADTSNLPNVVTATLPKTDAYFVTVSELLLKQGKFSGAYCLSLESSQNAWQTFTQK